MKRGRAALLVVGAMLAALAAMTVAMATAQVPPGSAGVLDFSAAEWQRVQRHGPWPPPPAPDPGNRLSGNPQAIALGQQLFFDPRLSGDGNLSCASCHNPARAFTDGLPRGVGRVEVDRNTPTVWNASHARWQTWDGAADSIWSQSIRALTDPREMASNPGQIARAIAADPALACRWQQLFGEKPAKDSPATLVNAAKAIGAFTATLVSGATPFDQFRDALANGDARAAAQYPLSAQRGLRIFVGTGQCTVCHVGPNFSNGEFGDIGRPFFLRPGEVDTGRHGGILALRASVYNLLSPWADKPAGQSAGAQTVKTRHVDLQHRNFGEFKVPSLRNVADTAPYTHDGQLTTLEAMVEHYSSLDMERLHADGEQILKPLGLTQAESADLVAFLKSLSDPAASHWKPAPLAPCTAKTRG